MNCVQISALSTQLAELRELNQDLKVQITELLDTSEQDALDAIVIEAITDCRVRC